MRVAFTHLPSVSTFDRVGPFQLTDSHRVYGITIIIREVFVDNKNGRNFCSLVGGMVFVIWLLYYLSSSGG